MFILQRSSFSLLYVDLYPTGSTGHLSHPVLQTSLVLHYIRSHTRPPHGGSADPSHHRSSRSRIRIPAIQSRSPSHHDMGLVRSDAMQNCSHRHRSEDPHSTALHHCKLLQMSHGCSHPVHHAAEPQISPSIQS